MKNKGIVTIAILASALPVMAQQSAADPAIKVNQVGYYPQEEKVAVIEPGNKAKSFVLKNASGKTVWHGKATRLSTSPFTGKVRQVVDFSAVKAPGTYTLTAGKEQQRVVIADHALQQVGATAMKAFYLQRMGMPIEAQYAGEYARPAAHMDEKVMVHPCAASKNRPAGTVISSPYGWYDAGDYNKYIVNSGFSIGVLLQAYELNKAYCDNMNLNIPESGNSIPDYLDEIMYNLKWMLTMQDPEDGGVYHKLTTPNFEGFVMPIECKQQRYVVQKSTTAALDFAASMALASRIYAQYPEYKAFAKEALDKAERAYAWAVKNPNVLYDQPGNNEKAEPKVFTGMYPDTCTNDEFFWAATELYITTKENGYMQQALQFSPTSYDVPVWGDLSGLGVQEWIIYRLGDSEEKTLIPNSSLLTKAFLTYCDDALSRLSTSSFNAPHGTQAKDFPWGSNAEKCAGQGIALTLAYMLTGDKAYINGALGDADYLLGRNATGYCFVTGFGTKQVMHPHQRLSAADGIVNPLPGFLCGGPNPGQQDGCKTYPSKAADESYTDDVNSYASNEIAINWNAYLVSFMTMLDAQLSK